MLNYVTREDLLSPSQEGVIGRKAGKSCVPSPQTWQVGRRDPKERVVPVSSAARATLQKRDLGYKY